MKKEDNVREIDETIDETIKDITIRNEEDFINKLSDISDKGEDFDLLKDGDKETVEAKQQEILDFIKNNDPNIEDENVKNEKFMKLIGLWDEMKDLIKSMVCEISMTNIECKVLTKKLHAHVEYTAETIFYGLHLKKYLLGNLPKGKGGDYEQQIVPITFSQAVGLYHVLSEITVKGLNKETYAYANILYSLSRVTVLYNYFDRMSSFTSKQMQEWNMALSAAPETGGTEPAPMSIEKSDTTD